MFLFVFVINVNKIMIHLPCLKGFAACSADTAVVQFTVMTRTLQELIEYGVRREFMH